MNINAFTSIHLNQRYFWRTDAALGIERTGEFLMNNRSRGQEFYAQELLILETVSASHKWRSEMTAPNSRVIREQIYQVISGRVIHPQIRQQIPGHTKKYKFDVSNTLSQRRRRKRKSVGGCSPSNGPDHIPALSRLLI